MKSKISKFIPKTLNELHSLKRGYWEEAQEALTDYEYDEYLLEFHKKCAEWANTGDSVAYKHIKEFQGDISDLLIEHPHYMEEIPFFKKVKKMMDEVGYPLQF